MYNCVILEDDVVAREAITAYVERIPYLNLIGSYESPLGLLTLEAEIDLVFSDILMPEMDGVSYFRSLSNPPIFIFITGNPEYAAESYDLEILDFVVKPFDFARFMRAANKAKLVLDKQRGDKQDNEEHLIVKNRNLYTILEYSSICFVQAQRDYLEVVTKEEIFTLWRKLADLRDELPKTRFMQVHKSYVVNLDFVKSISAKKLIMKGGLNDIPIGDTFKESVRRRFGID